MLSRLVSLLRRTRAGDRLIEKLRTAVRLVLDPAATFPLPNWWEPSFWEHTVALAIRDHCRPGDVVFDVGANAGGLAVLMSRMVGPRGIVCAFEASPRIIGKTHYNLVKAGCHNVTLFHKAVWHATGELLNIAPGPQLNDRVATATTGMSVRSVALDDFAAAGNFRPSFIKMDIEGAEFDALRGMPRLLREARPVLVLEHSPADMRCHALLTQAGYSAVDLGTYAPITSAQDFRPGTGVANVLFAPRETTAGNPYFSGAAPEPIASLAAGDFAVGNGDIGLRTPFPLAPGRYIVRAEFTAGGTDNEVFAGVEADGAVIFRYHTFTRFIAQSYRDWVIQLDRPARINPYLRFVRGSDRSLQWNGVTIERLPAFSGWIAPAID
jgi:FkbM family methyltransferase